MCRGCVRLNKSGSEVIVFICSKTVMMQVIYSNLRVPADGFTRLVFGESEKVNRPHFYERTPDFVCQREIKLRLCAESCN